MHFNSDKFECLRLWPNQSNTPEFEYFLLLMRICFDLTKLKDKHKNRLIELIPLVKNENNLFNYLNDKEKEHLISKINKLSVPIVKNYPDI